MCNCGQAIKKETSVKQVTKRPTGTKRTPSTRRVVVRRPMR